MPIAEHNPGNDNLLHALHLFSPTLPIGTFAYSQGLEYAIEEAWVEDFATAHDWLSGVMTYSLSRLDVPVLFRLYDAWANNDESAIVQWNAFVIANRETSELRLEDAQLGQALRRLLTSLDVSAASVIDSSQTVSLVTMMSLASQHWGIDKQSMGQGFLWSWLENQIAVLNKAVPMGQTDGQRLLLKLMPLIPNLVSQAQTIDDINVGASLPGIAMASALHETQYSRLFRS